MFHLLCEVASSVGQATKARDPHVAPRAPQDDKGQIASSSVGWLAKADRICEPIFGEAIPTFYIL